MQRSENKHRPVLLKECMDCLVTRPGLLLGDMTFGEGGHSGAMLKLGAARVVAIDRDSEALDAYREAGEFRKDPRLELHHDTYLNFAESYSGQGFDGILVDLGVSTMQLLTPERGFSLQADGPLDMRMDRTSEASVHEYLQNVPEEELANQLYKVADLKQSRSLARKMKKAMESGTLNRTTDLARVAGGAWAKTHPATPVFMALRMIVNDEYGQVERGLPALLNRIVDGGRLAVITFHSTEDRLVKRLFGRLAGRCVCESQPCECPRQERVRLLNTKPIVASEGELEANPRARSAKLRCVEKLPAEA